jgi:hypothetical protein
MAAQFSAISPDDKLTPCADASPKAIRGANWSSFIGWHSSRYNIAPTTVIDSWDRVMPVQNLSRCAGGYLGSGEGPEMVYSAACPIDQLVR